MTKTTKTITAILFLAGVATAQNPPARLKPITSFEDLEAGMPEDYVLTSLRRIYTVESEFPGSAGKSEYDGFTVSSGSSGIGEMMFQNGTLRVATRTLYQGNGDVALANTLFAMISGNSGEPIIDSYPLPPGVVSASGKPPVTKTWGQPVIIESQEGPVGDITLKFLIRKKFFNLSVINGHVFFSERIAPK